MENLNIDLNIKKLCFKAVNKYSTLIEAAFKLGVTEKTLRNYLKRFDIKWDAEKKTILLMGFGVTVAQQILVLFV